MSPSSLLLLAAGLRTLILPFDNVAENGAYDWKGSAFEETLSAHLDAAGHDVVDPVERNRALEELGFTVGEPLSRASAITLGRKLAAQRLVLGEYQESDWRLDVEARVIDLERGSTLGVIQDYASSDALSMLSNQVAKNVFRLESGEPPPGFDTLAARRLGISSAALEASARARLSVDADDQVRLLSHALKREPSYLAARLLLGRRLISVGRPLEGIEVLVKAGDDLSRHEPSYFELGLAYLTVEEPTSAQKVFEGLIGLGEDRGAASNNLGVALARLDDFDGAAHAFARAVDRDPTHAVYRFNHAFCLWRNGSERDALEELRVARRDRPYDAELQFLLSKAAMTQSLDDEAVRARTAALILAPHLGDVDVNGVDPWVRPVPREDPANRRADERDITEGEDVVALLELFDARELHRRGRTDDATQLLRKSLYRNPGALATRRELIDILRETGELDQAVRELHVVLWSDPSPDAHVALAEIYVELGDADKAKGEAEKALAIDPMHNGALELHAELGN